MSHSTIRAYQRSDAAGVVRLFDALGYPATTAEIAHDRFMASNGIKQCLLVADVAGEIAGWVHVCQMPSIVAVPYAEVRAIVVDPARQRGGLGKQLMAAAEAWATQTLAAGKIRLSSNITRNDAHRFYARLGYVSSKTSHVFEKVLDQTVLNKEEACTTRN
ncbi:GNAT family N-acetyltransferase [Burkholderiaceae bacterium DAT-1]|nr:GNAT family N-acetyltransferase [Burkholderiaceae bacterium DAT-1]